MTRSLDAERLAVLVHEVRSPVAALSAISESLMDAEVEDGVRRELVRLATLACHGIERIVTDAAVVSIRLEPVDVVALVADVVAAAILRGGRVELSSPSDLPLVECDPSRVRQALDNLIANALVHGLPDRSVAVRVAANDVLRIEIADKGPGIEPDQLERIFEIGVRLDPGSAPGAGLGLALARAIAEGHGGTLTVVSSPGVGTTFTLSLPLDRG